MVLQDLRSIPLQLRYSSSLCSRDAGSLMIIVFIKFYVVVIRVIIICKSWTDGFNDEGNDFQRKSSDGSEKLAPHSEEERKREAWITIAESIFNETFNTEAS